MDRETTFIYGLIDPRDNIIKYVGKSDDPEKRLLGHLKQCKESVTLKNRWVAKLKDMGLKPIVTILEEVPMSEWELKEQQWIKDLTEQGYELKNGDRGGKGRSGFIVSDETRQKLSLVNKGRIISEETRDKISKANKGKKRTREFRERMSILKYGSTMHQDVRQRLSLIRKGKPKPEGFGDKISKFHKGRKRTDETRVRISQVKQGWKPSPEMTEAQRQKCSGEGNGRAVLTKENVKAIRETYTTGGVSINELARRYGVNWSTIKRIVTGQYWKDVN